ncbi:BatA domain-containing protein [Crateriforma conspicua]|uniref:Aerotolerance regulator N-terminal domain-containing protein n=1 Tax=Crateriforma conspicua TaxID=2527996 RepID=A0A5C5Y3J1_9PLAN|nr:BatA domain-containing protein [Crateriforma conspicua]TWT70207.1 hypothetical protein Pan14r_25080 [Crateriforma conspicua]
MTFLQPWMLWALPLVALPIIIHLINQRRFQTTPWAAMSFLLAANRMSRGYAKLRRYLILAARTLVVAGLIFAVARPLSSGWLGTTIGSRVDTTLILLDRSPSMGQITPGGRTKLETLTRRLVESLNTIRSDRYVWIDTNQEQILELENPEQLIELSAADTDAATTDTADLLEAAAKYIRENQPGSVDCWIVSDLRRSDWNVDSGRWNAINRSLRQISQPVRFHLLTDAASAPNNRSLRVQSATVASAAKGPDPTETPGAGELRLSFTIRQVGVSSNDSARRELPIELDLNGARSKFNVRQTGELTEINQWAVPLDAGQRTGWGKLSIPADTNASDNEYYFVYGSPVIRKSIVVTEDAVDGDTETARPLLLAAGISTTPEIRCESVAMTPNDLAKADLDDVALVLWTGPLPPESTQALLDPFLRRGGRLICFAPDSGGDEDPGIAWAGLSWGEALQHESDVQVGRWIGDHDLLSGVRSGDSLPVGDLKIRWHRPVLGDQIGLAHLPDGAPIIARSIADVPGVYFIGTGISADQSSLARDGVVLYALIQRALADGADTLGLTQQLIAGQNQSDTDTWQRLTGPNVGRSTTYSLHRGVYQDDDRFIAINRGESEDIEATVSNDQLDRIFAGLRYDRIENVGGSTDSLIQEVWRTFLVLMMIAFAAEALLCLPRIRRTSAPASSGRVTGGRGRGAGFDQKGATT